MQGIHAGVAFNYAMANGFGFYLQGKVGWYDNDASQNQQFVDTAFTRNNSGSSSQNSTVYDLRLGVNYQFNAQTSMNLGYQVIDISNVALAESHFDTSIAGSNAVHDDNDVRWDGFNLGVNYRF
jgi:opacity protein-like surface antigen